ncbi:MAG TPA: 16S rRNA (uracil(1498)-N(3))-methyltransferase [Candidatus Paceibacterota bacterium]
MKIHRFIGGFDLEQEKIDVSDLDLVHQLRDVLRLGPGEEVVLGNGKGKAVLVRIVELGPGGVVFETVRPINEKSEPGKQVVLFAAVIKKDNFELVVQKTTEIGVAQIIPVISGRTVKLGLSLDRLRKITREAAEQSGRLSIPEIQEPRSLEEALTLARENDLNIFFDGSGGSKDAKTLRVKMAKANKLGIFIGPEGGWTKEELVLAKALKYPIVSLGKLTLRAETASMIATYFAVSP